MDAVVERVQKRADRKAKAKAAAATASADVKPAGRSDSDVDSVRLLSPVASILPPSSLTGVLRRCSLYRSARSARSAAPTLLQRLRLCCRSL
jgi:hypothetical protein